MAAADEAAAELAATYATIRSGTLLSLLIVALRYVWVLVVASGVASGVAFRYVWVLVVARLAVAELAATCATVRGLLQSC